MLRDFRQHLLSPLPPPFSPKNIPTCVPPRRDGEGAGAPPEQGWAGAPPGEEDAGRGARRYLLLQKDFHKFPKPAGIVVPHGFGVAEGFQQGGRLQDLPVGEPGVSPRPRHPKAPRPRAVPTAGTPLCRVPPRCSAHVPPVPLSAVVRVAAWGQGESGGGDGEESRKGTGDRDGDRGTGAGGRGQHPPAEQCCASG